MARIYANENFPQPVVEELRRLGHDVLTILEAGKAGTAEPDEAVLVVGHEGIIVCSFDPDFAGQALRIHGVIEAEGVLRNKLLRVNRS